MIRAPKDAVATDVPITYIVANAQQESEPMILVGLGAISRAVGAGQGTIKRWITEEQFPARRCSDGIYRASPVSIKQWFANNLLDKTV